MKFAISKAELFTPLQQVVGVVERKQTHEVMNNLLFVATEDSRRSRPESYLIFVDHSMMKRDSTLMLIQRKPKLNQVRAASHWQHFRSMNFHWWMI